uniref:Uncharacterized protein n=1 Tax=Fagus sylvatica TaxID=28930 RepID=A0A2N9EJM1_FAGSY
MGMRKSLIVSLRPKQWVYWFSQRVKSFSVGPTAHLTSNSSRDCPMPSFTILQRCMRLSFLEGKNSTSLLILRNEIYLGLASPRSAVNRCMRPPPCCHFYLDPGLAISGDNRLLVLFSKDSDESRYIFFNNVLLHALSQPPSSFLAHENAGSKGHVVIPEGKNMSGWRGFVRVTQKFGIGLTICLKENGVRRVSRDLKERDQSREQWVPHVSISNKAGESIRLVHPESLVGSPSRPTFEVEESSSEAQTLIEWIFLLKDGRRVGLSEFQPSAWPQVSVFISRWLPQCYGKSNLGSVLPLCCYGNSDHWTEKVGDDFVGGGEFCSSREVIPIMGPDPMEVAPISVNFKMWRQEA